jgi:hypothetical protein
MKSEPEISEVEVYIKHATRGSNVSRGSFVMTPSVLLSALVGKSEQMLTCRNDQPIR